MTTHFYRPASDAICVANTGSCKSPAGRVSGSTPAAAGDISAHRIVALGKRRLGVSYGDGAPVVIDGNGILPQRLFKGGKVITHHGP